MYKIIYSRFSFSVDKCHLYVNAIFLHCLSSIPCKISIQIWMKLFQVRLGTIPLLPWFVILEVNRNLVHKFKKQMHL
jgi:hypothetical protein